MSELHRREGVVQIAKERSKAGQHVEIQQASAGSEENTFCGGGEEVTGENVMHVGYSGVLRYHREQYKTPISLTPNKT